MRVNFKLLVTVVGISSFMFTITWWSRCDINKQDNNFFRENHSPDRSSVTDEFDSKLRFQERGAKSFQAPLDEGPIDYREIECLINGEYNIKCRKEGSEVYMPFSFLQKYFEVYGSVETYDGFERFEFQHSYSSVYQPEDRYTPAGVFMFFEFYNVEERTRVKCISGAEGVPISIQWSQEGYHYPIQISQYGLSHYSKYLREDTPQTLVLMDGSDQYMSHWMLPDSKSQVNLVKNEEKRRNVVEFSTTEKTSSAGISLTMEEKKHLVLTVDCKFLNNGSFTVMVEADTGDMYRLHYVQGNSLIYSSGKNIYYGIGRNKYKKWIHITRNILVDFRKGLSYKFSKNKKITKKHSAKITAISFHGQGLLSNVTLASAAHLEHFYDAADWLVRHQDDQGGWPIMVKRNLIPNILELQPGWYSAMAQGQAMSLLARAYLKSNDVKYLQSALKAVKPFEVSSSQGGVKARYANSYDWYEEYPTTPGSYVLNGFIYSLLGLYDLKEISQPEDRVTAEKLYSEGLKSLKAMLLMFDTGTGTFYDLRHITLGISPNRARWDYHTTHINQLLTLSIIDDDPIFLNTAKRWTDYMKGKWASHN
ncbi:hypothetical protein ScPMuIL_009242 [Solemya velum]